MQGCANDFGKLIGKVAVLRMAFGCPDAVPALSEWKRLGAMTTKGIDYSMNTINSEADDAKGLVENLVNNMDLTISGEGEFRKSDKDNEIGAWRLSKYIFDEVQAGRQPNLWVRFDFAGENAGTYTQHSTQHMERRHCAASVALPHCDRGGTGQPAMDG